MGSKEEKCQNNGKLRETLQTKEDTIGKIGVTEMICHGNICRIFEKIVFTGGHRGCIGHFNK